MGLPELAFDDEPATEKRQPATLRLIEMVPQEPDGAWHATRPKKGESCRWQRTQSEWVAVVIELDEVFVRDWRGQQQRVASFEAALRLGRVWCR
jgi:hypothetical protein